MDVLHEKNSIQDPCETFKDPGMLPITMPIVDIGLVDDDNKLTESLRAELFKQRAENKKALKEKEEAKLIAPIPF